MPRAVPRTVPYGTVGPAGLPTLPGSGQGLALRHGAAGGRDPAGPLRGARRVRGRHRGRGHGAMWSGSSPALQTPASPLHTHARTREHTHTHIHTPHLGARLAPAGAQGTFSTVLRAAASQRIRAGPGTHSNPEPRAALLLGAGSGEAGSQLRFIWGSWMGLMPMRGGEWKRSRVGGNAKPGRGERLGVNPALGSAGNAGGPARPPQQCQPGPAPLPGRSGGRKCHTKCHHSGENKPDETKRFLWGHGGDDGVLPSWPEPGTQLRPRGSRVHAHP